MSIFRLSTPKQRLRLGLFFILSLGLIVTALLSFPSRSRAKFEPVQETRSAKKSMHKRFAPGTVLVRYRSEAIAAHRTGSQRIALADGQLVSMELEKFEASELIPGLRLARVADSETLNAVAALRAQPDVIYAEPNYILRAAVTPNDPHFTAGRQSNMTMIGAPQAWNTTTGSASVVVGILDQGVQISHADLAANIWTNPSPGSLPPITGDLHGYNFVNDNGDVTDGPDDEVHGTHVSGIIGAVGNNNRGVSGVNWSVGLMPLKFLDPAGEGELSNLLDACAYAKQMRDLWVSSGHTKGANLRVLNASFGNAPFSQAFLDSINALNTSGILFVAAAGNTTDDGTREPNNDRVPHYPSSFIAPNLISVGASNEAGDLASSFSHFGSASVSLAAPGEHILSTTPRCADPGPAPKLCNPSVPNDANGDTYTAFDGTSMATPHVSGAAALLWAHNPNLTVQQVKNLLLVGGDIVPSLVDKTLTGRRLNIANSFQALAENDNVAPGTATNFHINSQNGRTFNLGWTTSGDDGATGQASLYQINFTDGGSGAVIPLKGVVPLASGSGQIATVSIPFRHTTGTLSILEFDNAGNVGTPVTLPVGIPLSLSDPYTISVGGPAALSTGGTRLPAVVEDDQYVDGFFPVGFTFPFMGNNYDFFFISSNGVLYFGDTPPTRPNGTADDVPSSPGKLGGYTAIAGLWDDLNFDPTLRPGPGPDAAGVYEVVSPGKVIYRFQGVPCRYSSTLNACTGTDPVNFEIELNSNGVIKTRYGAGNANLTPTVGIGGGAQESYFIASHSSEEANINLTNAAEVTFTPRTATVSNIQLTQSAVSVNEATSTVSINVSRTGDTSSVATVGYGTTDTAGPINCNNVSGTAASRRCDYLTSVGTLKFAAGETSKTITVSIINDVYLENPETFAVTLSSPVGATLGATTTAAITINDNAGGGEGGTVNPIFDAEFFVRQHYIDFLNREPDASGLGFWTNEITSCGTNQQCIDVKRVNVSAAFFLSIEFQETGYLVYRIYKAGLGNLPGGAPVPVAFTEFLRDTQEIGKGVQVGIGDWQNQLEWNKQAYAISFAQRPEFLAAYPNSMTATQVVNKMETNAGIALPAVQKTALINLLALTPGDISKRAAALRAVAGSQVLYDAEFNKAFVLMQYIGYLRRSPNEAPDSDFGGFNFWLQKLVDHHGNFADADMVKSFILSGEYLRRFQN